MMDTIVRPNDVVCVYIDEELAFFARIEEILPDTKPGWKRIRFKVLASPIKELVWILEPTQIDGESFTMSGTKVKIERLPAPIPEDEQEPSLTPPFALNKEVKDGESRAEIISFPTKEKK
jgi:hypothetical protein